MVQPEIPGTGIGKPVMPYGSDGSNWIALLVDALGRLQIDAEVGNFPADPATQTTLAAALTALQSIQNLVGALGAVDLDRLRVESKDGDKLFGFESIVAEKIDGFITGADGYLASNPVTTDMVWVITNIIAWNNQRALTIMDFEVYYDTTSVEFYRYQAAIAQAERISWQGSIIIGSGYMIRAWMKGANDGDIARLRLLGYQMNEP